MAQFKTRARAVDLLGRQQIAGIPTAISELFKNGHDAFAKHVEVDFYRTDRLFVLRDDGVGMTREDFEERWLVLGTESKLGQAGGVEPPFVPSGQDHRPVLGEKGIGRLAIAAVGPQVLVLSRAKRKNGLQDLVASFIHWGLFEAPGVNIDEITIPVRTFPGATVPDRASVKGLVDDFREGLNRLGDRLNLPLRQRIERDLSAFDVDPAAAQQFLPGPKSLSLKGQGTGTHFYLRPADEVLDDLLTGDRESREAPPLVRTLIGFSNTMTPGHTQPRIRTAFRDHRASDDWTDRIATDEFFTTTEFKKADHHFVGSFDELGRFEGIVSVYGEERPHTVESPFRGRRLRCGPFDFALAYVMGRADETMLPDTNYAALNRKLDRIGGLYVYRDNVRILPYGDPEFDFLGLEERRTKGIGYYFFSYRRMFGAVTLSRERNAALREKAGREGFIQDRAYADFREVLRHFFAQVAADFFRKEAPDRTFYQRREALQREDEARKRREEQTRAAQKAVKEALAEVFARLARGEHLSQAEDLVRRLLAATKAATKADNPAREIGEAEVQARASLTDLRRRYTVERPSGVGLSAKLLDELDRYDDEYARIEAETFGPAEAEIERIVTEAARTLGRRTKNRSDLGRAVTEAIEADSKRLAAEASSTIEKADEIRDRVRRFADSSTHEWRSAADSALRSLKDADPASPEAATLRSSLIRELRDIADREVRILASVREQLNLLALSRDPDSLEFGLPETLAAIESELHALRERDATDAELIQLGQALNVIDHEIGDSAASIRDGLRRLKGWADANPGLRDAYDSVRVPFEHLDSQLKLFTPLRRRLYRSEVEFFGSQVAKYLTRLFDRRLADDSVRLEVTDAFERYRFFGYPSSVYPAFVNLVDNALYWLKDRPEPRVVRLDAEGESAIVSDNGPGIPTRDRERVFEPGFTRKRFGRGLGLAVARRALADADYTLTLDETPTGRGASFRITPVNSTDEADDDLR